MNNIKLVCDSLSDVPKDLIDKYDIHVVPLTVIFDNKEYIDGVDLSKEDFYKMLRNSENMPKTSQCTYIQFLDVFKKYINQDKDVLYIGGSSTVSGTLQSAIMAKNDLEGEIHIFDTKNLSIGSACFVLAAAEMIKNGEAISNIINHLEKIKQSIKIFFTVDTLDYLQKGGRMSLAKATIGNMLSIKPIISIEEGFVKPIGQVRGKKQVLNKIINIIKEDIGNDLSKKRVIITCGDNNLELSSFKDKIEEEFNTSSIIVEHVGSSICAHTGPGIIGIVCSDI